MASVSIYRCAFVHLISAPFLCNLFVNHLILDLGCQSIYRVLCQLINLRQLYLPDDMKLSREIGQLSGLQTLINVGNKDSEDSGYGGTVKTLDLVLKDFDCLDFQGFLQNEEEEEGCGIEVLEGLNLLTGGITINHLRNVRSGKEAERANLMGKKNLTRIILSWHKFESAARKECYVNGEESVMYNCTESLEYSKDDEAVLEALQPHPNLKGLVIDQYFGVKLPRWMMGDPSHLPNLVYLQLGDCPKCEQLVGIGKLPSLKKLYLKKMNGIKCLGNEFYYNNHNSGGGEVALLFPSLKELVLSRMICLEEWVDIPPQTVGSNYSCFPCLEIIYVEYCPNLRFTPTNFPSLQELYLQETNGRMAMRLITTNVLNSLQIVQLVKISELRFLPHRLLQGSNVRDLKVIDCLEFLGFIQYEKKEGLQSSSLQLLCLLRLPALKFLPDIRSFTSLEELYISDCKRLKPIPEDFACLSSSLEHLKLVQIRNVKEVGDFEWQK